MPFGSSLQADAWPDQQHHLGGGAQRVVGGGDGGLERQRVGVWGGQLEGHGSVTVAEAGVRQVGDVAADLDVDGLAVEQRGADGLVDLAVGLLQVLDDDLFAVGNSLGGVRDDEVCEG